MTQNILSRCILIISLILLLAAFSTSSYAEDILCGGSYGGHLQGLDSDGEDFIFWSFTVSIVKSDMQGNVLTTVDAPSHQGDMVYNDGRLYVAVNLGQFNQEPGKADSWVYVYDADDLSLLAKHEIPELVHGAGGMAYGNGSFIVIGGLPVGYEENYAYEYDSSFTFVKRHVIESGYTIMGIQTACYADGLWLFGCYGYPENCAMLVTDEFFNPVAELGTHSSVGIAELSGGRFLQGHSKEDDSTGKWTGKARIIRYDRSLTGRFVNEKTR